MRADPGDAVWAGLAIVVGLALVSSALSLSLSKLLLLALGVWQITVGVVVLVAFVSEKRAE